MNHVSDWLTHIDNREDIDHLTRKLHDVSMRLFWANGSYRSIVLACCAHIERVALAGFDGYKLPHGTSGANVAIPFNIICIVHRRGDKDAYGEVMINPEISEMRGDAIKRRSNCGSIRLKQPILVSRREDVLVSFNDTNGRFHKEWRGIANGSLTIQHEVDHNNGILITDRQVK